MLTSAFGGVRGYEEEKCQIARNAHYICFVRIKEVVIIGCMGKPHSPYLIS